MDETGRDDPPRERSRETRGRSATRRAGPDERPGGGSASQRRIALLETQVTELAGTLSSLGPVLQQVLSIHANSQAGSSNQTQMPIPPINQGIPQTPHLIPPQQPTPTGVDMPFAQPCQ